MQRNESGSGSIYADLSERTSKLYVFAIDERVRLEMGLREKELSPQDQEIALEKAITQHYQKIHSDYPHITKYQRMDQDGRTHQIWVDERNHVTTYQLQGNNDDKAAGLLGTDAKAVVKLFDQNSYDYVKVDDFIDRANLFFDAAMREADSLESAKGESVKAWLVNQRSRVIKEIKEEVSFDRFTNEDIRFNADVKKDLEAIYNNGMGIVKQAVADVGEVFRQANALETSESIIKKIKQNEIELVRERGRPVIVKIGRIHSKGLMMSTQFPLGEKTIPSSDRTGKHEIKLSNHVRDVTGIVTPEGKIEVKLVIDGHSSYPPIHVKDEMERRYIAYQAVQERAKELLEAMCKANPEILDEQPIKLSLSSMMMLTPAIGKLIEGLARKSDSEHGQLSDTRYALEMFQQLDSEMEINGPEGKVTIEFQADFSYMNLPVNVGKNMQRLTEDALQTSINAKGFYDFFQHMKSAVLGEIINNASTHQTIVGCTELLKELKGYYLNEKTKKLMNLSSKEKKLNRLIKKEDDNLKNEYGNLKNIYEKIDMKNREDEYKKIRQKIQEIQNKQDALYVKIDRLLKNTHKEKKESGQKASLISKINEMLGKDEIKKNPALHKFLLSNLCFLRAEEVYYDKAFMNRRNAYQFHVNYLLANEGIGRVIEGFCKSSEDRTGWLRVTLLAYLDFIQEKKELPSLLMGEGVGDDFKRFYDQFFAAPALELSASLENTKYNSEARSLQVKGEFTNTEFNMEIGKLFSLLAKNIFKELPKTQVGEVFKAEEHIRSKRERVPFLRQASTFFSRPRRAVAISAKLYPRPEQVDASDLQKNGKLIAANLIEKINKYINKSGIAPPARLAKKQLAQALGLKENELPYSLLFAKDAKGKNCLFAIYHGVKKNKHIGKGVFGTVKLCQDLHEGKFYAIKVQKYGTDKEIKDQEHEMAMLKKADQGVSNVPYKAKDGAEKNVMIMEWAPGQPLNVEKLSKMTQVEILRLISSIIAAVKDIHDHDVIHRDIKPANIHFDPETGKVTVVDFGTALAVDKEEKTQAPFMGTPIYMTQDKRKHFLPISNLGDKITKFTKEIMEIQNKLYKVPLPNQEERENLEIRKGALERRSDVLSGEKTKLLNEPLSFSINDDIHSLGITLAQTLGLVTTVDKPEKDDFFHYRVQDSEACPLDAKSKKRALDILHQMTDDPPSLSLTEARQHFEELSQELEKAMSRPRSDAKGESSLPRPRLGGKNDE